MPKLAQFDAGNLALRPTEVGVEAQAAAARRIGAFSNQKAGAQQMLASETDRLASLTSRLGSETAQLGSEKGAAMAAAGRAIGGGIAEAGDAAVKYLDHQQISQGSAKWATYLQDETKAWSDAVKNADPNDPHVAQNYMEGLNDRLAKFQENGFYTEGAQKWAEAHTEALRQHMAEKTMSDMSTLAGQAITINHRQTVNALSATVHDDPASLDFALAGLKSSAEGLISSSPNLRGTDVARVRGELQQIGAESIVKSAAIGYIEKNGKMPEWVQDPKYSGYVNGAELKTLEKSAQVQQRWDAMAARQAETTRKQEADLAVHTGANKIFSDNVSIDPQSGKPIINPKFYKQSLDLVRAHSDAPSAAATARTMFDWAESQQNKELKVADDPTVVRGLTDRMFDPNNPTTSMDLMRARSKGEISDHTFTTMHSMVKELEESPMKGPVYQDTMKAAHDQLVVNVPGIPGKDNVGTANYAKFVQSFVPQYQAKMRAGTLEPNALDIKDPNSMISKAMAPFKRSSAERMSDFVAGAGGLGGAPARNDTMPAIPTPDQRQSGAIYETLRGKMKWTGTGWVAP